MKSIFCPICSSSNTKELYPPNIDIKKLSFTYVKTSNSGKTFGVLRCKKCSHVFCFPLPKNLYKNYEDVVDKQYLKYTESLNKSAEIILPLIKKYVPSGIILDVGCATGDFLTVARKFGYSVEGLELSKWSSALARKKGIKVYNERLSALSKKYKNKFDVITLFGVIEHFEYPKDELESIKKLLKPGGLLVIWTGDVDSISSKLFGRNWWYWQGQHIQYFSSFSLNFLNKSIGIKHLTTKVYPFVATYGLMNNSLSRYFLRNFIMNLTKPFFAIKSKWVFYIPGEMLWFGKKI